MGVTVLLLLLLAQMPGPVAIQNRPMGPIASSSATTSLGSALPFFSAFTASGAGTFGACSTTPPTGSKGEVLTFTRASSATCTKTASGGLATTGIADGDLVTLTNNQPRVEYDSAGVLGLHVEAAGTNLLLRSAELTNIAWSDVGTPTVTDGATDPFGGTTGDTIEDNDGAAFEGRSQNITVSAGVAHAMHCYVKAGTHTEARISIDGTTQDITGLSAVTWKIIERVDASSSGVSIAVQVLVGDAASDTGSVIWGGCDVKAGSYRTTMVLTDGAAATRAAEVTRVDLGVTAPTGNLFSSAVSATRSWSVASGSTNTAYVACGVAGATDASGTGHWMYSGATTGTAWRCLTGNDAVANFISGTVAPSGTRVWCSGSGVAQGAYGANTMSSSGAQTGVFSPARYLTLGVNPNGGIGFADAILSDICVDSAPTRCR